MRNRNSGSRSLGVWLAAGLFLVCAFTAGAASGGDNATFVSYSGVPSAMHPGDTATVTVTMRNSGTTTWKTMVSTETDGSTQTTTRTTYSLKPLGHGWGVGGTAVSGSVAPNATRSFQFTITAPQTTTKRNYVFRWQMARDSVVTERPIHARSPGTFGAATPSRTIQVGPDMAPSFGNATIPDQYWVKGDRITPVTLPGATGGNGTLSYALTCSLPRGVTFSSSSKTISGTPSRLLSETTCEWKVTDADDNTAASDADTETFTITVAEPDTAPSFSEGADDLEWVKGTAIGSVVLPAAPGGNGDPTYSLAGDLPAGVTFSPSTRELSGTPTATQSATTYTYTVTDEDGDAASLSFTIEVAGSGSDDASFVSYSNVPSTMTAGSMATVTVRMQNTGTTTWASADGYALGSRRPLDNVTWGLNRVSLPADVAPNATVDFTFEITAPATVQGHKFSWRMVRGASDWFGDKTEVRDITVEADESLSFGASTILGQTWVKDVAIDSLTLPEATGGDGELVYSLSGNLPAGVTFDATTRTLSGTPTRRQEATGYTYTATDTDGDAASLSFMIEVVGRASDGASFVSYVGVPSTMAAGSSATVTVRMQNTGTTTWTSADGYALGSQRPENNVTWGLSRVSLPSEVAPNATADFTFTITAPATVQGHNFRWRMLRGADGWFGDKTEQREITVEADESPSFGGSTIPAQTWVKAVAIDALTLPAATSGNGELTYALAGTLPAGVTFDALTRTLSGTPAKKQEATEYTYTATDLDGDAASLVFTIEVAGRARDDASFVSYVDVPSRMAAGSSATVTVRMRNAGTTTWTSADGYQLGSQRPQDNETWGLSRVSLPSDAAPNATVDFTFEITAPETVRRHKFRWQMVRGTDGWFGDKTELREITVEDPSFGDATIPDQTWVRAVPIDALTLPEASGGDGVLTYALTPSLPDGLTFTESTRTLSGTPTTLQAATEYTYTATDPGGDAATVSFSVKVEEASTDDATFVSSSGAPSKMAAGGTATVTVTMTNTGTTTWMSSAGYGLGSQSPQDNDTWGPMRASLSGSVAPNESAAFTFTITAPETTGIYTFAWRMVRDPGAWFGSGTGNVTITVEDPSFGDATISDQTWVQNTAIDALTLPAASGSGGVLTYALTPSLPDGLTFTESTRTLSGTPTAAQGATEYTYTATDADGDAATLTFAITVSQASSSTSSSSAATALPPPAPTGVFDMFEYWLLPGGSALTVQARLRDGRIAPAEGSFHVRSFWRGDLWGRKVALLGDPSGERYDIFEEVEDGLDYWGTFEGVAGSDEARPSGSLDRPFRWMNRFMAVGDAVQSSVTGRLLSNRRRNQESSLEATMRLEIVSHRASFTIPAVDGLTFEDVLEVRFWPDVERAEAHDTFYLARGYGAVYSRRSAVTAPGGVVEWWAVEKALTPVAPSAPSVPWFDPFSPGWPKTAVLNGNLDDFANGVEGGQVRSSEAPGWTADSGDAVIAQPPSGLDAGAWSMLLRGSDGGGDSAPDAAITEEWIPVEGGTYQLSACMRRESAGDNVLVDFDDGIGRDADFADAHLVATSTGTWECRAVTKCIPGSVGAVRIRAARDGANLGDAWFDRIELKRIAACAE